MPTERQREAWDLSQRGMSQREIGRQLGISKTGVARLLQAHEAAVQKENDLSPDIARQLHEAGIHDLSRLHSGWVFPEREDGEGRAPSLYFQMPKEETDVFTRLTELAQEAADVVPPVTPIEPRPTGDGLMVYNLADVHTARLCTTNQSGFDYSGKVALSRVIEGTEQLLEKAKLHGIGHIILTVGNDKMHFDTMGQTTTNGTPQEADTNLCNMYRNAMVIDRWVIQRLMQEGNVTIVHVPSNHDRVLGFCLAQQHLAMYKDHAQVTINEYLASERDRKYTVFNRAVCGFTHGDGWNLVRDRLDVTSGPDGRFLADTHWPGETTLELRKDGFRTWKQDHVLAEGEVTDLGDVVLERGALIAGRVVDGEGRPVAGAALKARPPHLAFRGGEDVVLRDLRLTIRSSGGAAEVTGVSDEAGRFRFAELEAEPYHLFVDAEGFEPVCLEELAAGAPEVADLEVVLTPEALLVLTVVDDASGEPVEHLECTVKRRSTAEDDDDEWGMDPALEVLLGREAAARLGLEGEGAGLAVAGPLGSVRTEVSVRSLDHAPRRVDLPGVAPGERLEHTLRLAPGAALLGVVVGDDGAPVADADVDIEAADEELAARAGQAEGDLTDAEGRFRLAPLAAGRWRVHAKAPGHLPSDPVEFEVGAGETRDDLVLTLTRGAVVSGRLLDATGAPATGYPVRLNVVDPGADAASKLQLVDGGPFTSGKHETRTDLEGRFRFDALPEGEARLRAHPGAEARVTTAVGRPVEVALQLRRTGRIEGRVVDGRGAPVEGVEVLLSRPPEDFDEADTRTDAAGEFAFDELVADTYAVHALRDAARTPRVERSVGWGATEIVDLAFNGGVVHGVVRDPQGQPVEGVTVELASRREGDPDPDATTLVGRARTDAAGAYRVQDLPPGSLRLSLRSPTWILDPREVELPPNATLERNLTVRRGGRLEGDVRLDGELPDEVRSLTLELRSGDGKPVFTAVKPDSLYSRGDLRTGTYRYTVRYSGRYPPLPHQDHVFAEGEVSVVEGETVRLDLDLVAPPP